MNPYKIIFQEIAKAEIEFLVVGGVAVNLYGYSRFTGDIDILLALDTENLEKMEKLMHEMDYVERLPVNLTDLRDNKKVKKWLKEKGMTAYTFLSNKGVRLDIDILVGKSLDFKKYKDKATEVEIWDLKLPVVSVEHLIEMKKEAGRDKDLLDIQALLELKGL